MKKILVLALLLGLKQVNAQVCFSPASNIAVGTSASSVISADFNGDGFADLAVANNGSGNVTVLTGDGAGHFSSAGNITAGGGPYGLCSGDFNGDSKMDIAVSNLGSNNVSVFLGNGNGTFGPAANFAVGNGPSSITCADFNKDGSKDLATANFNGNDVSVILGNGDGTFGSATSTVLGTNLAPHAITSADYDGDSNPDIAVANFVGNSGAWLSGNGSGGFGSPLSITLPANTNPFSVISADFNADGKMDIAFANSGSTGNADISVVLNTGSGLGSATSVAGVANASPTGITSGDFDGDGKTDLVLTNQALGNASVYQGGGTGTFTLAATFNVGSSPNAAVSADFNGDGKTDIASANWNANSVSILLNTQAPAITAVASADSICPGGSDTLWGQGGVSYVWTGGVTNATTFTLSATKTYTVTGTNANGCTNKASVTITVNPAPTLTITASNNPVCHGSSVTLTASGAGTYTWNNGIQNGVAFTPTATAVDSVWATSTAGCKSAPKAITVTVAPLPNVMITASQDTICTGDSSLLIAHGAATYTWSPGSQANDSVYVSPTTNSLYMVTGTDANGCQNSYFKQIIVNCLAGIQQIASSSVRIYPNPNNGTFMIEPASNERQTVQVMDINGRVVLSQSVEGRTTIDAANLNGGVYSVSLLGAAKSASQRLVIVK